MGTVKTLGRTAFRKYVTDGVPASGAHQPDKDEIFDFVDAIDANILSIDTYASVKALAAADAPDFIMIRGFASNADGRHGLFSNDATKGVRGYATINDGGQGYPLGQFRVSLDAANGDSGTGAYAIIRAKSEVALQDANGNPKLPVSGDLVTIEHRNATAGFDGYAITGATQANPVVLTLTIPDDDVLPLNNNIIEISGVSGMTQLNGNRYRVASRDTDAGTVELQTLAGVDVDGSAYGAYTSGGAAVQKAVFEFVDNSPPTASDSNYVPVEIVSGSTATTKTVSGSDTTEARADVAASMKNLRDAVDTAFNTGPSSPTNSGVIYPTRHNIVSYRYDTGTLTDKYTGFDNKLQLAVNPESPANTPKGDTIRVSATFATSGNVQVIDAEICDAYIIAAGSGYEDTPTVSPLAANWKYVDFNDVTGGALTQADVTFDGTPSACDIEFALSDDVLTIRTTDNETEYRRDHAGIFRPEWAGGVGDGVTDDSTAIQNLIKSICIGDTDTIERYGAGSVGRGGTVWLGRKTWNCDGQRIHVNPGGNRHSGEVAAIKFAGAGQGGTPQGIRPSHRETGAVLLRCILSCNMPDAPDGNTDYIAKGLAFEDFVLVGGLELFSCQQCVDIDHITVAPFYPVGEKVTEDGLVYRRNGAGVFAKNCSLLGFYSCFTSNGDIVLSPENRAFDDLRYELNGWYMVNCNQVNGNASVTSECLFPIWLDEPDGENPCANFNLRTHLAEANAKGLRLLSVNNVELELTAIAGSGMSPYDMGAQYAITAVSVGSPSTLTTIRAPGHNVQDGDVVYFSRFSETNQTTFSDLYQMTGTASNVSGEYFDVDIEVTTSPFPTWATGDPDYDGVVSVRGADNPRIIVGSANHTVNFFHLKNTNMNGEPNRNVYPDGGVGVRLNYCDKAVIDHGVTLTNYNVALSLTANLNGDKVWYGDLKTTGSTVAVLDNSTSLAPMEALGMKALDGWGFAKLTGEPDHKYDGMLAYADGVTWDPLGNGRPCLVMYVGSTWYGAGTRGLVGLDDLSTGDVILELNDSTVDVGVTLFRRDVNNESLSISGGNLSSQGAKISMYGGSHSTFPNNFLLERSNTDAMLVHGATGDITWYEDDGSTVGVFWDASEATLAIPTLKTGTHTTLGGESVTGYIEIEDAGGTTRKLAVVS